MDDIITSRKKLSTKFQFLVNSFREDIYRRHCYLCDESYSSKLQICEPCFWDLPWQERSCIRCGLPHASAIIGQLHDAQLSYPAFANKNNALPDHLLKKLSVSFRWRCIACYQQDLSFDRCITPFTYQYPVSDIILNYKYQRQRYWRSCINRLFSNYIALFRNDLYDKLSFPLPDIVVPVPISPMKLYSRQFNQAEEIARNIAKALAVPQENHAVIKVRDTPAQASLSFNQRQRNSQQAFSLGKGAGTLQGKAVMIVDDVITTGSTANQMAKLVKQAGATSVEVWGLARTPKTGEHYSSGSNNHGLHLELESI